MRVRGRDRQRQTETDRPTDRPTDRQTDRLTDRQTDRQTDRETDRQTDRQTDNGAPQLLRCSAGVVVGGSPTREVARRTPSGGGCVWGQGEGPIVGAAAPRKGSLQHSGQPLSPTPTRHHPLMACAFRPPWWGGARWGATSAWCALGGPRDLGSGLAAHEVARARKELPARRLADTLGLRARCVGQAAWHPATATQRWLARRLLQKPPFIASGLPRALPAPTALGRCVSVVWAWVSDDIKGFSRGNMAFSFTP